MLNKLKEFNWVKNMFLVPILLVAGISISHVVSWYDMANPYSWAVYLSIAIEIGAMTSLIAATKKIKGGVWFMFGLVTFIQLMGNIFYSYVQIDESGELFKNWIELTSPLFEMMGTDPGEVIPHKRWLALLEGGLLPLISLTALHFYIKYDDSDDATHIDEGSIPKEPNNDDVEGQPMDLLIGEEDNTPPLEDYPKNGDGSTKTDDQLGKYDMKFGPEYTKMLNGISRVDDEGGLVKETVEVLKPEEKSGPMEMGESENERQKHLKYRKRITMGEEGKKTLTYPKRDKITQKISKSDGDR